MEHTAQAEVTFIINGDLSPNLKLLYGTETVQSCDQISILRTMLYLSSAEHPTIALLLHPFAVLLPQILGD